MLTNKVNSIFIAALFIFILGNIPLPQRDAVVTTADKTSSQTNLNSRLKIQFQFQAYTNINSEFNIEKDIQNYDRPFQGAVKFFNPLLFHKTAKANKALELSSVWAKNKILQQLLPFHGFS